MAQHACTTNTYEGIESCVAPVAESETQEEKACECLQRQKPHRLHSKRRVPYCYEVLVAQANMMAAKEFHQLLKLDLPT